MMIAIIIRVDAMIPSPKEEAPLWRWRRPQRYSKNTDYVAEDPSSPTTSTGPATPIRVPAEDSAAAAGVAVPMGAGGKADRLSKGGRPAQADPWVRTVRGSGAYANWNGWHCWREQLITAQNRAVHPKWRQADAADPVGESLEMQGHRLVRSLESPPAWPGMP